MKPGNAVQELEALIAGKGGADADRFTVRTKLLDIADQMPDDNLTTYGAIFKATFDRRARGICGFLSYLFDDGEKWAGNASGEYEPTFLDIHAHFMYMKYGQDFTGGAGTNADLLKVAADKLDELRATILNDPTALERNLTSEETNDIEEELKRITGIIKNCDDFYRTADFSEYEKLNKTDQKALIFMTIDRANRVDFFDQITLETLTKCYEMREPTDAERKRWENEDAQAVFLLAFSNRLTVSDIIRIYQHLKGTGWKPPKPSAEAKRLYNLTIYGEEGRKRGTPSDLSKLGLLAAGELESVVMSATPGINAALRGINTTKKKPQKEFDTEKDATITTTYNGTQLIFTVDGYYTDRIEIRATTWQLFCMILTDATEINHFGTPEIKSNDIRIPLETYYKIVNENYETATAEQKKEIRKYERKKLKNDIEALFRARLTFGNEEYRLITYKEKELGQDIHVKLSEDLIKVMNVSHLVHLPKLFFRIDARRPGSMTLCYGLSQRRGNDALADKGTAEIVSIDTAREMCALPPFNEVKGKRRHYDEIQEQIENNFDHLQEIGFLSSWEYCESKGAPLPPESLPVTITSDEQAKRIYIKYTVKNWDELGQRERIERKKERRTPTQRKSKNEKQGG